MTTLREIRRKIQSIAHIQQITQAMELVAASRLRKAQAKAELTRPYAAKVKEIVDRLIFVTDKEFHHPLLTQREIKKIAFVIVGSDRGLCGAYNQRIIHHAEEFLQKYPAELIVIGRKIIEFFRSKKWAISHQLEEWGGKITYPRIEELTRFLMTSYMKKRYDEIWIVYTHFTNVNVTEVKIDKFLPIDITTRDHVKSDTLFEPDPTTLFAKIIPRYCTIKIQAILNESYASELAARIASMRSATQNAEKMGSELTLERNKLRQFAITKELIEITSGVR